MSKVYCKKCKYAEMQRIQNGTYGYEHSGRCTKNPLVRSTPMEEITLLSLCEEKNAKNDCKDYESKT